LYINTAITPNNPPKMKSFVAVGLAAAVAAYPQAGSPSECSPSADGTFSITTVNATETAKRSIERRQLDGELQISLEDGVLKDQAGRTGYIASNYQYVAPRLHHNSDQI
jgi:hypothetical protein